MSEFHLIVFGAALVLIVTLASRRMSALISGMRGRSARMREDSAAFFAAIDEAVSGPDEVPESLLALMVVLSRTTGAAFGRSAPPFAALAPSPATEGQICGLAADVARMGGSAQSALARATRAWLSLILRGEEERALRFASGWARRAGLHADAGLVACVLTLIQLDDAYAGRACAETHAPTRWIQAQGIRT